MPKRQLQSHSDPEDVCISMFHAAEVANRAVRAPEKHNDVRAKSRESYPFAIWHRNLTASQLSVGAMLPVHPVVRCDLWSAPVTRAAQVHSDDDISSRGILSLRIAASQPDCDIIASVDIYEIHLTFPQSDFCRVLVSQRGCSDSKPCQLPWDLWWAEWLWNRFFLGQDFWFPPSVSFHHQRPTIFIFLAIGSFFKLLYQAPSAQPGSTQHEVSQHK